MRVFRHRHAQNVATVPTRLTRLNAPRARWPVGDSRIRPRRPLCHSLTVAAQSPVASARDVADRPPPTGLKNYPTAADTPKDRRPAKTVVGDAITFLTRSTFDRRPDSSRGGGFFAPATAADRQRCKSRPASTGFTGQPPHRAPTPLKRSSPKCAASERHLLDSHIAPRFRNFGILVQSSRQRRIIADIRTFWPNLLTKMSPAD
jgi:hypothetical protein